jgi:hypothetical protein
MDYDVKNKQVAIFVVLLRSVATKVTIHLVLFVGEP